MSSRGWSQGQGSGVRLEAERERDEAGATYISGSLERVMRAGTTL